MLLCTVIESIASALASALDTTGGLVRSCGNWRTDWETLSLTSLAAASRSIPSSNSMLILLRPTLEEEVIFLIPAIQLIAFSNGYVI